MTPHTIKMAVNPKHPNAAAIKGELQGFIDAAKPAGETTDG